MLFETDEKTHKPLDMDPLNAFPPSNTLSLHGIHHYTPPNLGILATNLMKPQHSSFPSYPRQHLSYLKRAMPFPHIITQNHATHVITVIVVAHLDESNNRVCVKLYKSPTTCPLAFCFDTRSVLKKSKF